MAWGVRIRERIGPRGAGGRVEVLEMVEMLIIEGRRVESLVLDIEVMEAVVGWAAEAGSGAAMV